MPDNDQQNDPQQGNSPQNDPGNTGGGAQGTDGKGVGTGAGTSPAFDDETNAERGQSGEGGIQQEGAWRPSDDDAATQEEAGGTESNGVI